MRLTDMLILGAALGLAILLWWRSRRRPGCPRCDDGDHPAPRKRNGG